MPLVKVTLLFPTSISKEITETDAHSIQDVIETLTKQYREVREYFFLDDGQFNGATFVTINEKVFSLIEAAKLPLRDSDRICFGQVIDGG